ncbi:transposon TX1 [Tanacetum coccineum]
MGNLWMIFKKYGTVYDMFMVRRRLRNGQRFGFVRLKNINDVDSLLKKLEGIRISNNISRVYKAYDRKENKVGSQVHRQSTNGFEQTTSCKVNNRWGYNGGDESQTRGKDETFNQPKMRDIGVLELGESDIESTILNRGIIGEVQDLDYLEKLPKLCEIKGLKEVEIKYLGRLERLVVFDTIKTATNVMENVNPWNSTLVMEAKKVERSAPTIGEVNMVVIVEELGDIVVIKDKIQVSSDSEDDDNDEENIYGEKEGSGRVLGERRNSEFKLNGHNFEGNNVDSEVHVVAETCTFGEDGGADLEDIIRKENIERSSKYVKANSGEKKVKSNLLKAAMRRKRRYSSMKRNSNENNSHGLSYAYKVAHTEVSSGDKSNKVENTVGEGKSGSLTREKIC